MRATRKQRSIDEVFTLGPTALEEFCIIDVWSNRIHPRFLRYIHARVRQATQCARRLSH
jgi:hypothetical protein